MTSPTKIAIRIFCVNRENKVNSKFIINQNSKLTENYAEVYNNSSTTKPATLKHTNYN